MQSRRRVVSLESLQVKTLNYCWRLIATGICFFSFSAASIFMGLIVFPVVSLLSSSESEKRLRSRRYMQRGFRAFNGWMSLLGVIDFDIDEAVQQLSNANSKLVVANHPSLIDVVALISALPQADCIIKADLWNNPFFSGALNAAGYTKNDGHVGELMEACSKSLSLGNSLVIFPEGTRTIPGRPIDLQRGAANIALRCNVDLVPVFIKVSPTTLTKSEHWYDIPAEKVRFSMKVGGTIAVADFQNEKQSLAIRARQLTAYLKERMIEGLKSYE